jgi:hypothetical protein
MRTLAAILSANAEGDSRLMGEDKAAVLISLKVYRQAMRSRSQCGGLSKRGPTTLNPTPEATCDENAGKGG